MLTPIRLYRTYASERLIRPALRRGGHSICVHGFASLPSRAVEGLLPRDPLTPGCLADVVIQKQHFQSPNPKPIEH